MLSRLSNLNLQRTIPKNIRTIATAADLKCFKVNVLQNGVAMITIDCPNAPVNSLTAELQDDLPALLSIIEGDDSIKACVLRSDKKNNLYFSIVSRKNYFLVESLF